MCKIMELNIMFWFMITNFGFVVLKVSLALESVATSKELYTKADEKIFAKKLRIELFF